MVEATAMLVQRLYDELSLHVPRELEHDLAVSLTSLQRLPESPYQYASRMVSLGVWLCLASSDLSDRVDAPSESKARASS